MCSYLASYTLTCWFFFCRRISIGDVVVLKDPANSSNFLVRRLAAVEGYEMVSSDEKDEPFVLEENHCWVLADNENIKPKVCAAFHIEF